ncbi:MAG TPA: type IV pilus modification protein PilV [Burkholderiaceae bacterium]|nr:type IV pilus modification protein PilV [Burkholderiaceae bacterium]
MKRASPPHSAQGFALIEVLVTLLIVAFALVGLAGLVGRSFATEADATQRTQALLLVQDMVDRLNANRKRAADYITDSTGALGGDCATQPNLAARDKCEWANLLMGANEKIGADNAGVLMRAKGCIYQIDAVNNVYAIAVAWLGQTPTAAPATNAVYMNCGQGEYGNEDQRRVVTSIVRIGSLALAGSP